MWIACVVFVCGLLGETWAAPKPGCDPKHLDECAADVFLFASKPSVPGNASELEAYCKVQKASEVCARENLEKCTDGVARGIATIFLDDIRDEIETRCDPSQDYYKEYLQHAACLNILGDGVHQCLKGLVADLDAASQLEPKHRIGGSCCKFNVFDECLKKATEGKCEQGGADFANALLQKYAGELLSTVCSAFKSGERCASISFANTKGDTSLRSVLAPLIKVSDALG